MNSDINVIGNTGATHHINNVSIKTRARFKRRKSVNIKWLPIFMHRHNSIIILSS